MISRTEAERIAAAISHLRPDWLASSITTLIVRDLTTWTLLDITAGLAYIAVDRKPDGSWASKTPGRVREHGPWRTIGTLDPDVQAERDRAERDRQQQITDTAARHQDIAACTWCDHHGRLPSGTLCLHVDPDQLAARAAARAGAARAAIRPTIRYEQEQQA